MTNIEQFNIIYKHFARPIADMKITYNDSAITVEAGVVNSKVSKCFENLPKNVSIMLKISFLEQNKKRQHYPQKKTS